MDFVTAQFNRCVKFSDFLKIWSCKKEQNRILENATVNAVYAAVKSGMFI